MPQPKDNDQAFALAYNLKKSAKRYAKGGQVGLGDRKERLRGMLSNQEPVQAAPADDFFDLDEELPIGEDQELIEKPSRQDRIREILTENRVNSLKKD